MGKKGMQRPYKCKYCNRHFAMEWAKNNCEKHCEDRKNALERRQ